MHPNLKAFLDTIAFSELGKNLLAESDNGYNVIVGSMPGHMDLMDNYLDHPRKLVNLPKLGIKSTAAGRYQILKKYYDAYKSILGLKDFSPAAQDAIAIQLIKECRAIPDIEAGHFTIACAKCASRWASLPGAGYGQHENTIQKLKEVYIMAGGQLANN